MEFWNHKWLDGKILREHVLCPIPDAHSHYRVCDYWVPGLWWDWGQFSHTLPLDILHHIASFELPSEVIGDRPMWLASKNGRFSIKSAIRILQPMEPMGEEKWAWIWRTRLPYRIQMFLWLLQHQKIMTNAEQFRRKLSSMPQCDICCEGVEDLDHLLQQCLGAEEVWQSLQRKGIYCQFVQEDFKDWLQKNLAGMHQDSNWPAKFATTLWFIWKWRCAACFGSTENIPTEKGLFLCDKFQEILQALESDEQLRDSPNREPTEQLVRWEPPDEGWSVLHTNEAAKGCPGPAGAGGVIRGAQGDWIVGFSEHLGCQSRGQGGFSRMQDC